MINILNISQGIKLGFTCFTVCLVLSGNAAGQVPNGSGNRTGSLVGGFLAAIQKQQEIEANQKTWVTVPPDVKTCLGFALARNNLTVDGLISSGVSARDPRLGSVMNSCNIIANRQLRINVPCQISDERMGQVSTVCSEYYAQNSNGTIITISRDDFIRISSSGASGISVILRETPEGKVARLEQARLKAEADRQNYLNSPEGRQQAALEAAQQKQREDDQKRKYAEQKKLEAEKRAAERDLVNFKPY